MKPLTFRAEFESDLLEAAQWYEDERIGLGVRFIHAVDGTLATVRENPALYGRQFKNIRRASVRGFPFGIFYHDDPDEALILALWHASRDPEGWQARI